MYYYCELLLRYFLWKEFQIWISNMFVGLHFRSIHFSVIVLILILYFIGVRGSGGGVPGQSLAGVLGLHASISWVWKQCARNGYSGRGGIEQRANASYYQFIVSQNASLFSLLRCIRVLLLIDVIVALPITHINFITLSNKYFYRHYCISFLQYVPHYLFIFIYFSSLN